jgi:ABC-type transport system substrate-binding protein
MSNMRGQHSTWVTRVLFAEVSIAAPTLGFMPAFFPRDPLQVNTIPEHMVLGQVLETLVTADNQGNLSSGIAKSWHISKDGLKLEFDLKKDKKFSNNRPLKCEDVKYSIDRHVQNKASQSNAYLSDVVETKCLSESKFEVRLSEPNMSILKVLSRDQVGIMPKHWEFNPLAEEVYIGSGPYRILRGPKGWLAVRNKNFEDFPKGGIETWELKTKLVQYSNSNELPDVMPFVNDSFLKTVSTLPDWPCPSFS